MSDVAKCHQLQVVGGQGRWKLARAGAAFHWDIHVGGDVAIDINRKEDWKLITCANWVCTLQYGQSLFKNGYRLRFIVYLGSVLLGKITEVHKHTRIANG